MIAYKYYGPFLLYLFNILLSNFFCAANKIVEIRDGELILYRGDYHYYLDKIEEEKQKIEQERIAAEQAAKSVAKKSKQKTKKGK